MSLRKVWLSFLTAFVLAIVTLCIIFHHYSHSLFALFWPSSVLVWLKVIAYGVVPMGLAIFGAHYAAEAMRSTWSKRMARILFILIGVACVLMISYIETKSDREHMIEVGTLNVRLDSLGSQETLTLLRHEWILSHKDISPGLLTGAEQPPTQWINQRLKQLGEKWIMESEPPKASVQSVNSPDPYVGTPNPTVAMWTTQMANGLSMLGNQCMREIMAADQKRLEAEKDHPPVGHPSPPTPEMILVWVRFWQAWTPIQPQLAKLHDSLISRVGPVATISEEEQYKELLDSIAQARADRTWTWTVCQGLPSYARELQNLGTQLGP